MPIVSIAKLSLIAVILSMVWTPQANAKRKAPPEPISVTFGDGVFTTSKDKCGVVEYRDEKGKLLRKLRFYRIFYRPRLEKDVQDVWFTDLFRMGDELWARDEKGRIYQMSLKLMKPRRVKHLSAEEFQAKKKSAAELSKKRK